MKFLYISFILAILQNGLIIEILVWTNGLPVNDRTFANGTCYKIVSVLESTRVPYLETYKQKTWGIFYKTQTRWNFRIEYHRSWREEEDCCDGYERLGLKYPVLCKPTCIPDCGEKGDCISPNVCLCNYGYNTSRVYSYNGCVPQCYQSCVHGKCVAPDICECNFGYRWNNQSHHCEAVCTPPCPTGAYCYTPDRCLCKTGWKMIIDNDNKFMTCEPVCKEECVHGKCTDPVAPCTCDDGYKLEGNSAFICSPICNPGCSSHGKCTAPNVCTCNEGYSLKPPNICQPICSQACVRGTCTAPETCSCNTGYGLLENSKYICEPICEKACLNGKCTAPGVCTCNEGFRLSDNETEKHICKPHCEISCGPSGVCIAPDVCNCFKGFHPNKTQIITNSTHYTWLNDWVCKPVCETTCINGYCNAPGMCSCNIGYQPSGGNDTSVCVPICNQNCVNGFCSEPETCTCNEGYGPFNSSNICEPICETDCINGHCTAPNECTCNSGYQPTEGNHTSLCEPICNPSCKNGICVQPNKCDCNPGYRLSTSLEANTCDPICHPACETNGICKAPDLCVCEDGYRMIFYEEGSVPFKCEPICSVECGNGVCTAPDVCTCFDDYQRAETGGCEPFCSICVNGTCVAPEVCECDDGYSLQEEDFNSEVEKSIVPENGTKNGSKCVPRCESCDNGDCVAPGECRCRKGFVKFEGICVLACPHGCDTHGECIDEHRICECHYGWTGLRCDRPIFCVSILNDEGNRTEPLTIIKECNTTIEYVFINNPVCPECTKKYINNETLCFEMFVNGTKDEKQIGCLMTKECHALSSPYKDEEKIIILTSGIIVGFGILFLAITIIYLLLRKDPDRQMDLGNIPIIYKENTLTMQGLNESNET